MRDITKNEMKAVLEILKNPQEMYNANNLAKELEITSMGALKILKRLESESILISREIGKARIYRIDLNSSYAHKYVSLILSQETITSNALVKRWVKEVEKIKHAQIIVLFGSVLRSKNPNDIDVLFVTEQSKFSKLQQEVKELNSINAKPIHAVYQSHDDLINNIKNGDKVILNAIKGIVVKGEEKFLEVYHESRQE